MIVAIPNPGNSLISQVYLARVYHRRDGHAGQGKGRRGQQYALF